MKNKQECVGIVVYVPEFKISISKRLSDQLSYSRNSGSHYWVTVGLEVRPDRVVVYTDSIAALESIQSTTTATADLLIELYHSLLRLHIGGIDVQLCWVPAHEG